MVKTSHRFLALVVPFFSLLLAVPLFAAEFYVAPNGSSNGSGSFRQSLGSPDGAEPARRRCMPGDTIWLRGGTYTGIHTSYLNGTSFEPDHRSPVSG